MKPRHVNVASLVFGGVFVAIATSWFLHRYTKVELPDLGWVVAVALIGFGLTGIIVSLTRRSPAPPEPEADAAGVGPGTVHGDSAGQDAETGTTPPKAP